MTSPPQKKILKGGRLMGKAEKAKAGTEERKGSSHTAEEKCRAVLSVWTERRKPAEVCREVGVAWTVLNQWQGRAMEGMLLALKPRAPMAEKTVALNVRLAVLLERKSQEGLERRLTRLQSKNRVKENKPEESKEHGA
jgi:transposase-like protein